ncbi:uncharacterized protein N7496_009807 [Penicillium cataractarum]|uniref:Uncharacterized protein n=1 Tax=Penicillium cataractarum TaxID=2100454 RepID=A0A9W9RRS4_9EURO|nr:uncharacterized protein N7496_009807 [Penicillium cataractarum]KAJ5364094.1 hypothetical protein N7496_009807 [Penicillium cataractarum]
MVHFDDLRQTAYNAEKDLNSYQAKQGRGRKSDSTLESGVDEMVDQRFPQSGVKYGPGSAASGSDHRKIREDEGGTRDDRGRLPRGDQFLGQGGPEDKLKIQSERRPGDQGALNLQTMKHHGIAD